MKNAFCMKKSIGWPRITIQISYKIENSCQESGNVYIYYEFLKVDETIAWKRYQDQLSNSSELRN